MQKERMKPEEGFRFRILTEISQQITSVLDIDELLVQVVRLIQRAFNYYHVGIGLIEGDEVVYRVGAGELWDDPHSNFQFRPNKLKVGTEGLTGRVASTGEPALVPDVTQNPNYVWMEGSLTRSELIVPIIVKGRTIGVLDLQSQHLDTFDPTDLELMQAIANQAAVAIENARLFSISQRRVEQFKVLIEVSRHITSILDINELLKQLVELIQRTFKYHHVEIGLVEGNEVVFNVGAGYLWEQPEFQVSPSHIKTGLEGVCGRVAATGKPVIVPDVSKDPDYIPVAGSRTRSELAVPIISKAQVIGVLDMESARLDDFGEIDLEVITSLANQAGIAIENAHLFAEIQRLLKEAEGRAGKLAIMNSIQQGLASKLDVQSIYELVGDKFHDLFDAQVVLISTYDQQSDTVEHRYAVERGVRIPWPGKHPPGGFRSQIIQTRQPLLLNTGVAEKSIHLGQPVFPDTDMPKSWLGVPMFEGDKLTGIMSIQNLDRENAFYESDIRLLQMFAASMSIALENARLYEESKQHAVLVERQRLAQELHDSVTQSLYGISLYAQAATGNIRLSQTELAGQYLEDIQNTAQESLAEMRLLIYELKPPILEKEGLVAALQNRLNSVEDRVRVKSGIQTNLTERLPAPVENGLYQIAREALNNIIKHAHAKNVLIRIERESTSVVLEIADNGIGFEPGTIRSSGCLGLVNMQECARTRGWQLGIESSPGNGTRIKVEVETR
jgi:signal transduction histidine kinase